MTAQASPGATGENMRYIVNVEAAIYRDDRWLMIERSEREEHAGGTLAFVGGMAETDGEVWDVLEETLRREVREEVGIAVGPHLHYSESKAFLLADGTPTVSIVFLCEYAGGTPRAVSADEVAAIYWMTAEEVLRHPKTPYWIARSVGLADALRRRLHDNATHTSPPPVAEIGAGE
jgi:8-oxo-dGTP diphosphatase